MQDSQLLKFINGVSSKKFAGAQQYLQQWSTWLSDQKWATVTSTDDPADKKLLEIHKAAVKQLIASKPTSSSTATTTKAKAKTSGEGNYVAEIWAGENAEEPEYRKRSKSSLSAKDWACAKLAEIGGNDWTAKVIDNNGRSITYTRQEAIYHAWGGRKPTVAYKKVGVSTHKWEMRARNDHFYFSRA